MILGYKINLSGFAITALILLLAQTKALAQLEPNFGLFRYNQIVLNPGYTGLEDRPVIGLSVQNLSYSGNPFFDDLRQQTLVVSADAPVRALHGGLGVMATGMWEKDRSMYMGSNEELSLGLMYSFHIRFSEFVRLGLGTQVAVHKNTSGPGRYQPEGESIYPEADIGLWLQGKRYSVGASMKNILRQPYSSFSVPYRPDRIDFHKFRSFILNSEYRFTVSPKLQISPAAIFQIDTRKQPHFSERAFASFNNTFIIAERFHAGAAINSEIYFYQYGRDFIYRSFTINAGVDFADRGQLIIGYTQGDNHFFNTLEARLLLRL